MKKLVEDVTAFHSKFGVMTHTTPGHLSRRKFQERLDFLKEELAELEAAGIDDDLAAQGDALIDLIYVAVGTGLMMGLPLTEMWDEVQRANMEKVRGTTHRGNKVDVAKPEGWRPPDHERLLFQAGYSVTQWVKPTYSLKDGRGRDDE